MNINKNYVVYELNNIMGNEKHKSMEKVEFSGWKQNSFDSEEEAIAALVEDKKKYEDYVILRQVYIN